MALFPKTKRTDMELALTRFGNPDNFDESTLLRIEKQNEQFLKPKFNYSGLSLIPLAIIAFMILKK